MLCLQWNDKAFKVTGKCCIAIKLSTDPNPPEGMSNFIFDRQLLHDVGVQLVSRANREGTSKCSMLDMLNKKAISTAKMMGHLGYHILNNGIGPSICGFCDEIWCSTQLHKTSASCGISYFKIKSDCKYFLNGFRSIPTGKNVQMMWWSAQLLIVMQVYGSITFLSIRSKNIQNFWFQVRLRFQKKRKTLLIY